MQVGFRREIISYNWCMAQTLDGRVEVACVSGYMSSPIRLEPRGGSGQ